MRYTRFLTDNDKIVRKKTCENCSALNLTILEMSICAGTWYRLLKKTVRNNNNNIFKAISKISHCKTFSLLGVKWKGLQFYAHDASGEAGRSVHRRHQIWRRSIFESGDVYRNRWCQQWFVGRNLEDNLFCHDVHHLVLFQVACWVWLWPGFRSVENIKLIWF